MKWVEMQEVKVGDHLRILHQAVEVRTVKASRGDVHFFCQKSNGEKFGYTGVDEELVPLLSPGEVAGG